MLIIFIIGVILIVPISLGIAWAIVLPTPEKAKQMRSSIEERKQDPAWATGEKAKKLKAEDKWLTFLENAPFQKTDGPWGVKWK